MGRGSNTIPEQTLSIALSPCFSFLTKMSLADTVKSGDVSKLANLTDINASDENGKTALHYAAELGNAANVQFLLSSGAEANATDSNGYYSFF